jgi:hypothetical protein
MPVGLVLPPPIWPTWLDDKPSVSTSWTRHWSSSGLRCTSTRVGRLLAAMMAAPMMVFPSRAVPPAPRGALLRWP